MGVIDESYKGDNDQWFFPAYALRDTVIEFNDRICQFRIMEKMPAVELIEVDHLGNEKQRWTRFHWSEISLYLLETSAQ